MNDYSNIKPYDLHGFKEEVKIEYNATKAIARKFPNGIAAMMVLLRAAAPAIYWTGYCALTPVEQLIWEERDNELNKAMFHLLNSKNKQTKEDLHLAYFQGNLTAYPPAIKGMARYLSTKYPNNKPTNQRDSKKEDKKKGNDPQSNDKDNNMGGAVGSQVEDTTTPKESTTPSG